MGVISAATPLDFGSLLRAHTAVAHAETKRDRSAGCCSNMTARATVSALLQHASRPDAAAMYSHCGMSALWRTHCICTVCCAWSVRQMSVSCVVNEAQSIIATVCVREAAPEAAQHWRN